MNEAPSGWKRVATAVAYVWLFGGMAYYLVRFSRSFYVENEYQIRQALESLLGK